jgi:hypothetical protein
MMPAIKLFRDTDLERANQALHGLLEVEVDDKGHLSVGATYNWEKGRYRTIDFNSEYCEKLSKHDDDVGAAIVAHLQWVIAEHQKNLDAVTKRLRRFGLID